MRPRCAHTSPRRGGRKALHPPFIKRDPADAASRALLTTPGSDGRFLAPSRKPTEHADAGPDPGQAREGAEGPREGVPPGTAEGDPPRPADGRPEGERRVP